MNAFSLENCAALVTNSGSELGLTVGLTLRTGGATVVFHGREARPSSLPADCPYSQADLLLQRNASRDLIQAAWEIRPELNRLICLPGSSVDAQLALAAVNCIVQHFADKVAEQKRTASIVLVLHPSVGGNETTESINRGLRGMTASLAASLRANGIRINAIDPGDSLNGDIAAMVVLLSSGAAKALTGHVLQMG